MLRFLLETDAPKTITRTIGYRAIEEIAGIEYIGKAKETILTIDTSGTDFIHPGDVVSK
jgi:hypothetical protein